MIANVTTNPEVSSTVFLSEWEPRLTVEMRAMLRADNIDNALLIEKTTLRMDWNNLSEDQARARWMASFEHRLGQKAWFERDMYMCPAFFLSEQEQLESMARCGVVLPADLREEVIQALRFALSDSTTRFSQFWEWAIEKSFSLYSFTAVVASGKFYMHSESFHEWWNGRDSFAPQLLAKVIQRLPVGVKLSRTHLCQIVDDSNWKDGDDECRIFDTTRAFGPKTLNGLFSTWAEDDEEMEGYDLDELSAFLWNDVEFNANRMGDDLPMVIWYNRDSNARFRNWLYCKLGRDIQIDIVYNQKKGFDVDYLWEMYR